MHHHLVASLIGALAGCAVTVAVAIATRVRLLPEVVDISLVPTGLGSAASCSRRTVPLAGTRPRASGS
jgi:hypothetical protein